MQHIIIFIIHKITSFTLYFRNNLGGIVSGYGHSTMTTTRVVAFLRHSFIEGFPWLRLQGLVLVGEDNKQKSM